MKNENFEKRRHIRKASPGRARLVLEGPCGITEISGRLMDYSCNGASFFGSIPEGMTDIASGTEGFAKIEATWGGKDGFGKVRVARTEKLGKESHKIALEKISGFDGVWVRDSGREP